MSSMLSEIKALLPQYCPRTDGLFWLSVRTPAHVVAASWCFRTALTVDRRRQHAHSFFQNIHFSWILARQDSDKFPPHTTWQFGSSRSHWEIKRQTARLTS